MIDHEPSLCLCCSVEEFNSIRPYWELFQKHPNSDIDYFISEAEEKGKMGQPAVAAYKENGAVKVILAGRIAKTRENARLGFRRILGPELTFFSVPSGGLMCGPEGFNCDGFLTSLGWLVRHRTVDAVRIGGLEWDGALFDRYRMAVPVLLRPWLPFRQLSWKLRTKSGYEAFMKQHPKYKKTQRQLLNKMRRGCADRFRIEMFSAPSDTDMVIDVVKGVSCKSWQEKTGERRLDPVFLRRKVLFFSGRGQFIAYVLYAEGSAAAFLYGFNYKDTLFLEGTAFDPDFRSYSPGTLLFMAAIDGAFEDNKIEWVDFGAGNDQGKALYCDTHTEVAELSIYAPRPAPVLANVFKSSIELMHQGAKGFLKKAGVADKLRQRNRRV